METLGPEASQQFWQSAAELIRADLEATTDLRWALLVEREPFWGGEGELCFSYGSSGSGLWPVPTEQSWSDAIATGEIPGGETVLGAASAELADRVAEDVMESLQSPWPECNVHRRPMDPTPVGPTGLWRCAKDPRHEVAIGSLAAHIDAQRRLTF
jgi:hypothetical protein